MVIDEKTENDIIKCSRCGLCADVCPLYKAKPAENKLLRGKFLQLLGVIKGDLKFSKAVKASLEECLACEKCVKQCPSGLNAVEIFEKVKYENLTPFEKFLTGNFVLKIKLLSLKLFYLAKHPVKSMLSGKKIKTEKFEENIIHFNGCLSKATGARFLPHFEITEGDFECCGVPFKTKGNLDEYKAVAARNTLKIENSKGLVVFNCATCLSAVRSYVFKNPKTKDRLVFYTELYKKMLQSHQFMSKKPVTVTFHHPCHLESAGVSLSDVEELLKSIKNVNYIPLENPDDCCGFGGDYFTRHARTADRLSTKKAKDILGTGAEIVLTCCPTCLWSLKYGLKKLGAFDVRAVDLAEFLSGLVSTDAKD